MSKNKRTPKIQKKWNLGLLYRSPKDPKIEKDLKRMEKLCRNFAKKYEGKTELLKNEKKLATAIEEYESLIAAVFESKPLRYFSYLQDLNSEDKVAEQGVSRMSERITRYANMVAFFPVLLGSFSKMDQKRLLSSTVLKPYHYFLRVIFRKGRYTLSVAEEKLNNLKQIPGYDLWVNGVQKALNTRTVLHCGKEIPLSEAQSLVQTLPTARRRKLQRAVFEKIYSVSDFSESEINALYTDKKIEDGLRGYEKPYESTVYGYENTVEEVEGLVKEVTDHFSISKRFYKLKTKMLKLDHLEYADRAAEVGGSTREIPFEEAVETLREVFTGVDPRYGTILDRFLENGQIDVYPKRGKSGGAFCSSGVGVPTYVLLNHTSDMNSLMTFAHEMGHAVHAERSKKEQRPLYQDQAISAAEVASTLFEQFTFDHIFRTLSEKEKIKALHDKIQGDIATVFRQIACFNFEKELHQAVRSQGFVQKEDIARLMDTHMKSYLGPGYTPGELDGYFFIWWSHIRRYFYVYSYAYGKLVSKALHAKCVEDPAFKERIDTFLSAGGSESPHEIFSRTGIDTTDPAFFRAGLEEIRKDIIRLEKLVK